MTDLTALVRSELTELADASQPSADLADRAVTAGVRRRRWHRAATGAAAAAAAVAVTLAATQVFAPQAPQPRPAAADPRNAVYATDQNGLTARVLDPTTGEYRAIGVDVVSAPTTDLRHAAVTPPRVSDGQGNPIDFPPKRVGRYDATTGDIRWYDVPLGVGAPAISPDGRYIATPAYAPATRMVLVDTQSGAVQVFTPGAETLAAAGVQWTSADMLQNPPKLRPATDLRRGPVWRPDSRHFLLGNAIIDLTGRQTGTVPMPDRTWLIAPRPDGEGLLVVPDDALDTFALTDASGRVGNRVQVSWPSCTDKRQPPDPVTCPTAWNDGFLGWRGDHHLLVPSQLDPRGSIDALDVRTGQRTTVTRARTPAALIVPADHLPPHVRDTVAF